jgi:hypothetical protein
MLGTACVAAQLADPQEGLSFVSKYIGNQWQCFFLGGGGLSKYEFIRYGVFMMVYVENCLMLADTLNISM